MILETCQSTRWAVHSSDEERITDSDTAVSEFCPEPRVALPLMFALTSPLGSRRRSVAGDTHCFV